MPLNHNQSRLAAMILAVAVAVPVLSEPEAPAHESLAAATSASAPVESRSPTQTPESRAAIEEQVHAALKEVEDKSSAESEVNCRRCVKQ